MSKTIKSFAAPADVKSAEPIEINLGEETVEALGDIPGLVLLKFLKDSGGDSSAVSAGAIYDYLKASFDAENFKKFEKFSDNPSVDIKTLADIVSYLIEERASRPTKAS